MSGHHHHHDHTQRGLVIRPLPRLRTRRAFLGDIGGGALALAVLTPVAIAACSDGDSSEDGGGTTAATSSPDEGTTSTTALAGDPGDGQDSAPADGDATDPAGDLRWSRANLGFVSAYVVARGNRAAIVDTGGSGSSDTIGESLAELGLNYNDVESVILTHNHDDHVGSIGDVLAMAVNATAYAGEADLGGIDADVTGLVGGEDVFGMEVLATPGHTPGSMSVIDRGTGLLIAGDALTIDAGQAAEPPARFTADVTLARDSITTLAAMTFNTLLVGHGDPIESGADASVAALAASF